MLISKYPASQIQLDDGDDIITTLDSLNIPSLNHTKPILNHANPSLAVAEEVARVQGSLQSCCFEHLLVPSGGTKIHDPKQKEETQSHAVGLCPYLSV